MEKNIKLITFGRAGTYMGAAIGPTPPFPNNNQHEELPV